MDNLSLTRISATLLTGLLLLWHQGGGSTPSIEHGETVTLQWQGSPATAFWAQRGTSPGGPWSESIPPYANGSGMITHIDLDPLEGQGFYRLRSAPTLAADNFDSDPRDRGWDYMNFGRFIQPTGGLGPDGSIRPDAYIWRSPPFDLAPFEYYRVDFRVKSDGTEPTAVWVSGLGHYDTTDWGRFYSQSGFNATDLSLWDDDWAVYPATHEWTPQVFYTRVRANASTSAALLWGFGWTDAIVDDVVVTPASREQVRDWADAIYAELPPLAYTPPANRHTAIAETLSRLHGGETVRMVFVGDSLVQDLANSTIDVLLERTYPGSRVDLVTAGASSTGMDRWNSLDPSSWPAWKDIDLMAAVVLQQPDLVLLGGISNGKDWNTHFPGVIDKIRTQCQALYGNQPEIIIATGAYFFAPPPSGLNADLAVIATTEGCAFFDLHSAFQDYLSSLSGSGLTSGDFQRDSVHANQQGKQIFGRILLHWFSPDP